MVLKDVSIYLVPIYYCNVIKSRSTFIRPLFLFRSLVIDKIATMMLKNSLRSVFFGARSFTFNSASKQGQGLAGVVKLPSVATRCLSSLLVNSRETQLKTSALLRTSGRSVLTRGIKSQAGGERPHVKFALWKRVAVVAGISGIVGYSYYSINQEREIRDEQIRYEEFQKAKLGGDWTLTDHHGKERSSTEFRGQWVVMYFGFTHCPDICPEELEKLVSIVKVFDENPKLPSLMPIFVTLDPERDTPEVIKDYLAEYKCPRLLGFTAPEEKIKEMATRYRAYYSKGPPDEDNDYIVDHTIIIYLINPKGEFVNYFDRGRSAERIIKTVTEHIDKFNELEGRR